MDKTRGMTLVSLTCVVGLGCVIATRLTLPPIVGPDTAAVLRTDMASPDTSSDPASDDTVAETPENAGPTGPDLGGAEAEPADPSTQPASQSTAASTTSPTGQSSSTDQAPSPTAVQPSGGTVRVGESGDDDRRGGTGDDGRRDGRNQHRR
ncbi:MAG: hypothetical protein QM621_01040 [Aeromicrobium sp.]|uniref:hypothetical protein n=1 Tax=Aeromicrobium sp. TaxID=1871063 RepID=UPI0039E346BC